MKMIRWIKTHSYCYILSYFIFYLLTFCLLEKLAQPRYIMHCMIDDKIPFCEWFVIPYFLWFPLLAVSLGYLMFKSKEDFQNLCFLMFNGMTVCLLIYMVLPNGLNLRRPVTGNNVLCALVRCLYAIDSPTNVCPSIHVSSTVAINMVVHRSRLFEDKKWVRWGSSLLMLLICLSTLFIKQHSVIDLVCGIVLSEVLCFVTYHMNWRSKLQETKMKALFK